MKKTFILAAALALSCSMVKAQSTVEPIGKSNMMLNSKLMTPEALWAMGRIASAQASPDGKSIVYQVGYYSVKENKSRQVICIMDKDGKNIRQLTTGLKSESDPVWIEGGKKIAFICGGQLFSMNANGSERRQLTKDETGIDGFKFSPDGKKIILIKQIPFHESIKENPSDLPQATGRLVTDLNYRHWDEYVETIPHPFLADVTENGIEAGVDMLAGEPFECPMKPFGGVEQLDWSRDSKSIAYTCRKKKGVKYAVSTDSDIYLYDVAKGKTVKNLCKQEGYVEPEINTSKTLRNQSVNSAENMKNNPGYDQNPKFSPDGKYIAWQSMAHDGYESDRNRICVYNLATGEKTYVTESFDSNAEDYCWMPDSKSIAFTGVWHGTINLYRTNLSGKVEQLTNDWADYVSVQLANSGNQLLTMRQSMAVPTDIYSVTPGKDVKKTKIEQLTTENKQILDQLALGKIQQRWVKTSDGKDMLVWIILPSDFDPNKKYPTLLFCEGGPQSPVSQFWSYRWNMQIMAAHGYVVVAPNRRGQNGTRKSAATGQDSV